MTVAMIDGIHKIQVMGKNDKKTSLLNIAKVINGWQYGMDLFFIQPNSLFPGGADGD